MASAAGGRSPDAVARDLGAVAPGRLSSVMNATQRQAPRSHSHSRSRSPGRPQPQNRSRSKAGGRAARSGSGARNNLARPIDWQPGLSHHDLLNEICAKGTYAEVATSAWNFAISRDLRRAALFLWITSLSATRSSTLIASSVAASAALQSPDAIATSAFFTKVRASVRSGLFSSRRRSATRIRFFDDFELAKRKNPPQIECKKDPLPRQRATYRTKLGRPTQDANTRRPAG